MTIYDSAIQQQLISALQQHRLTTLDFSQYDPDPFQSFAKYSAPISCLAVLPNGQVVSGSSDNTLQVWDVSTGQCLKTLTGHTDEVTCLAVLPNGQVVSGSRDNTLRVWDVRTGQCLKTMKADLCVTYLAMLPNGWVVSVGNDSCCPQVWDVSMGKCLKTINGYYRHIINDVAALPNGQVVTACRGNFLWVIDVTRYQDERICCLKGHTEGVICVAALPNNQVVSSSWDKTLRIWDTNTGECLKTMNRVNGDAKSVLVLPNGQVVIDIFSGTLEFWDVHTGQCLKTLASEATNCLAVLPNGQIVMGFREGTLKCWTPFPRHRYHTIASVLQAITPECGLQELSLRGVDLGQVGYKHLRELVQNVSSLKTLDLRDTDLMAVQFATLQQIVNQHRVQNKQHKAQTQATRDQLLQAQLKRFQEWEPYIQKLQLQYDQQESVSLLTYPEVTFTCPVIEKHYDPIEEEAILDEFLCPITRQIMWEPVMADDGYTYERDVIEAHFQRSLTSPMLPEEPLASQRLVLNRNVCVAIQRLLERHPEWALYQPDTVYFSSTYEATVQTAIVANDRAALLRAIDQEPRLLTRSLTQGMLIEQVWDQAELLEAVLQRFTPVMWSHLIQKAGGIWNCLGKLARSALASQLQQFNVFLSAFQVALSCEYPTESLIAQGLHQSLPVLLLLGLNRLSGVNSSLDTQQNTALHYAAASGDLPLVTVLLEHGATITLKNKAGQTPKTLAQLGGHDEVVAYCQKAKLQPLISQLLGSFGFLNVCQHQELREMVHQQQATILQLQNQIQAQNQELQRLREHYSSDSSGNRQEIEKCLSQKGGKKLNRDQFIPYQRNQA